MKKCTFYVSSYVIANWALYILKELYAGQQRLPLKSLMAFEHQFLLPEATVELVNLKGNKLHEIAKKYLELFPL